MITGKLKYRGTLENQSKITGYHDEVGLKTVGKLSQCRYVKFRCALWQDGLLYQYKAVNKVLKDISMINFKHFTVLHEDADGTTKIYIYMLNKLLYKST